MPDVTITDKLGVSGDVQLSADSPLAKSGLTHLTCSDVPLVGEFGKPIDQCSVESAEFGSDIKLPEAIIGGAAKLTLQLKKSGSLAILKAAQGDVFPDDFSPSCPIAPDECWMQLTIRAAVGQKLQAAAGGFGFGVEAMGSGTFGTYVLFKASAGVFPTLKDSMALLLERYRVGYSASSLREQIPGTILESHITGSIKFSASYSWPLAIDPLASADLPFNYQISLSPEATARIGGQITLTGEFAVRAHRRSASELTFGVYRKKGATFTATFSAAAGLEADAGGTDLIPLVFGAMFPGADLSAAGLTGEAAQPIATALKESIDQSLAVAMNAAWSASLTNEAALVYSIDLSGGDASRTDEALSRALEGDWTKLDGLPNAKCVKNIFREAHQSKHTLAFHLLGLYNASSVSAFLRSCTVLHDENGQVIITDRVKASQLAVAAKSTGADTEKVRAALSEAFVATVSYVAAASGAAGLKLGMQGLSVQQTYVRYRARMGGDEMRRQILLARAVRLSSGAGWDQVMASDGPFEHARVFVRGLYDGPAAQKLLFRDPATRAPWDRTEVERVGRQAMAALLYKTEGSAQARLAALNDDAIWNEMNKKGNTALFKQIGGLSARTDVEVQAIAADWVDITTWATALIEVAPKVADVLVALDHSQPDPSTDATFMQKRKALADALGSLARHSHAAFADGFGLAAAFLLSGGAPSLEMELAWNGISQHYESQPVAALAGPA